VAGGGALGSLARYWHPGTIGHRFSETFPYGTLVVNMTGCLATGFFATPIVIEIVKSEQKSRRFFRSSMR
jgi:fluoride ion exporter CrcB/FEX